MKAAPTIRGLCSSAWAVCGLMLPTAVAGAEAPEYLGPRVVLASKDAKTLYVANADARQIAWVELPGGNVARRVEVPAEPTGMVLSPDGTKLIVTCAAPKSTIAVIDTVAGKIAATIPAGHTATCPVITPDGKRLYVCNQFDNDVSVIDLATSKQQTRIKMVREPTAAAVTPDGQLVLVANFLPNAKTDAIYGPQVAAIVAFINTKTNETTTIELQNGTHSLRSMCISPDGKYAYITHILSNFDLLTSQLDQGWMNINAISVIDIHKRKLVNTVGLDETFQGTGNVWGICCTADGKWICVSHAGTHQLSIVDASAVLETLVHLYISPLAGAIPDDPRLATKPQRRVELPGKGPRGLTVVGSKVYVVEYFSDTLAVVDLQGEDDDKPRSVALGPKPELTVRRQGELLFNDATICYQHWQSCASCHPDGRSDALNWDLLNDGVGNFKNTKSLVLSHDTPPSMFEAVRPTAEAAVRAGLEHILFAYRPEHESVALDEYIKSLKPVPSPYLVDGKLSPAAERGKKLFRSARVGCHRCHPSPLYTDLKMHDVGTRGKYEYKDKYDTPTLIEVWRTAPYLHDGRYTTIKELIVEGKHVLSSSRFESLSEQEINDLVEFVLSL